MLILIWVAMLIISFTAGAEGPPVLSNSGRGTAFNYTSGEWNMTYDPNGTTITFHIEPHVYQQFIALKLWVAHPGSSLYNPEYQLIDFNEDYDYIQKWKIESYGSNSLKRKDAEEKFIEDASDRKHFSSALGLDMSSSTVHESHEKCKQSELWCQPNRIWHVDHISKKYYFFKVVLYQSLPSDVMDNSFYDSHLIPFKIKVFSMNPSFTTFELGFKYSFLAVTLLVLLCPKYGYFPNFAQTPLKSLSSTHWWLLFLLQGLVFFNEPFIGARVNAESLDNELTKFATFSSTLYICFLLYYWLVLLDDCRLRASITSVLNPVANPFDSSISEKPETQMSFAKFYLPKMCLVFTIWCLMFITYVTAITIQTADPSFQLYGDANRKSSLLRGLMDATLSFLCIYVLWIIVVIGFLLKRVYQIPRNYQFLAILTLLTLTFTLVGIFIGIAFPIPNSSFIFLGFYGMINCYVWVMSIAWTPEPSTHDLMDRDAALELAAMADSALGDLDNGTITGGGNGEEEGGEDIEY